MVKSVEILIELNNERYYLDYDKVDGISLNYNINRIQELENLDSSYSQSIKLVNSKNNQKVLGYISNLNIENGSFDPNKKTKATILVDSVSVFDGYLQLLGIEYNDNVISYNAVIYADNANLYSSIENKFLTDLDFSRYNYTYDFSTFLSTATSSADKDPIIFPIIDYGNNWTYNQISGTGSQLGVSASQIDMTELYPATYVKSIVDQIFTDAGYKYESEFLNSYDFKRLIIPFTNEKLLSREEVTSDDEFEIFSTTFSTFTASYGTQSSIINTNFTILYNENQYTSESASRYNTTTQEYINGSDKNKERFGVDLDLTINAGNIYSSSLRGGSGSVTSIITNDMSVDLVWYRQYDPSTGGLTASPTIEFHRENIFTSYQDGTGAVDYLGSFTFSQESTNFWIQDRFIKSGGLFNPIDNEYYIFNKDKYTYDRKVFGWTYSQPPFNNTSYQFGQNCVDLLRLTSKEILYTPWLDGSTKLLLPLQPNETIKARINIKYNRQNLTPLDGISKAQYQNAVSSIYGLTPVERESFYLPSTFVRPVAYGNFPQLLQTYPFTFTQSQNNAEIYDGRSLFNENGWIRNNSLSYNNTIYKQSSNETPIGGDINIALNLPNNTKQIDFLKSVIRMFNLYVEPSKDKLNTLLIQPRDDYYNGGTIKDWSRKVDLSKPVDVEILSNTQAKETILTYREDDDFYNTLYKKSFNEIYGQYKAINDNNMVVGQKILDVIFSPTPNRFVYGSDIVISTIQPDINLNQIQGKKGNNIRILYCDVVDLPVNRTITIESTIFSNYLWAGHLDNPYSPNLDLSFLLPKKIYYDFTIFENPLTYNSLYNLYHRNMFEEIYNKDSRIVKVNVMLNNLDIYNFTFKDKIYLWINEHINGYFIVNSIEGWDPINQDSVVVELLKVKNTGVDILISNTSIETTQQNSNSLSFGSNNIGNGNNTLIFGRNNEVNSDNTLVFGNNNYTDTGESNFIYGQNNQVDRNSSANHIFGSNNNIFGDSDGNIVLGDNNKLGPYIKDSFIMGNNNEINRQALESVPTDAITYDLLDNVFIHSNSNTIYNIAPDIHFIDLQLNEYYTRLKCGVGDIRNKIFPDISTYLQTNQIVNATNSSTIALGTSIIQRTDDIKSIPFIQKTFLEEYGGLDPRALNQLNILNKYQFSGTYSYKLLFDDINFPGMNNLVWSIIEVDTHIVLEPPASNDQYIYHSIDVVYINPNLLNPNVAFINNKYSYNTFPYSISIDYEISDNGLGNAVYGFNQIISTTHSNTYGINNYIDIKLAAVI